MAVISPGARARVFSEIFQLSRGMFNHKLLSHLSYSFHLQFHSIGRKFVFFILCFVLFGLVCNCVRVREKELQLANGVCVCLCVFDVCAFGRDFSADALRTYCRRRHHLPIIK